VKQALIVAFLGTVRDRFTQMGEPLSIREKLRRAALIPGVEGAEIIFPDECHEPSEVLEALAETGLVPAAINVNLKGRPEFQKGALSVCDPEIRGMAVDQIIKAKEFALRAGAERVTCAPLADGVDYALQQNHAGAWRRTVETLQTAIEEGPNVPLYLEHKPSDPRVHGLLSSSDIILQLLHDIGQQGAGITFNVGHSSLDGLSPAASLAQVLESGVPLYVHLCDAAGGWDWDLLPGSYHPWHLLEFLQGLSASGYDGWLTSDSFPLRHESRAFSAEHIQRTASALRTAESAPGHRPGSDSVFSWKDLEAWLFPSN
jgi:sugar phosphate isomerase/epimerase